MLYFQYIFYPPQGKPAPLKRFGINLNNEFVPKRFRGCAIYVDTGHDFMTRPPNCPGNSRAAYGLWRPGHGTSVRDPTQLIWSKTTAPLCKDNRPIV
jgi:hypothetical protein